MNTMRNRFVVVVGLAFAIAATGCLNETATTASTPPTTGGPAGNVSRPADYAAALSGCEILGHSAFVDEGVHHVQYPDGVRPVTIGGRLQVFGMHYLACRQSAYAGGVSYDFQLFTFGGSIEPPSSEAANLTASVYLLEAYTNSRSLIEIASRAYGVEIRYADSIVLEKTQLNPPPYPTFAYSLMVPYGPQSDYSFEGHMWKGPPEPKRASYGYFFTNSSSQGQLNHFRLAYEGDSRGNSVSVGMFGPDSSWGKNFDVDTWDFLNIPYSDVTATLSFHKGV